MVLVKNGIGKDIGALLIHLYIILENANLYLKKGKIK